MAPVESRDGSVMHNPHPQRITSQPASIRARMVPAAGTLGLNSENVTKRRRARIAPKGRAWPAGVAGRGRSRWRAGRAGQRTLRQRDNVWRIATESVYFGVLLVWLTEDRMMTPKDGQSCGKVLAAHYPVHPANDSGTTRALLRSLLRRLDAAAADRADCVAVAGRSRWLPLAKSKSASASPSTGSETSPLTPTRRRCGAGADLAGRREGELSPGPAR